MGLALLLMQNGNYAILGEDSLVETEGGEVGGREA